MTNRLTGLDGLRGVAALCVLVFHLNILHYGKHVSSAFLAVDFFFMLSGYVMARTYEEKWIGPYPVFGFMRTRLKRLWPTMAIGALIGVPVIWATLPRDEASLTMLNIFLIPTFSGITAYPINFSAWSIFFELLANLVHVVILARLKNDALFMIAAGSLILLLISGHDSGLNVGSVPADFIFGVPRVLLSYTMGIILWRKWKDIPPIVLSPKITLLSMPLFFVATGLAGEGMALWPIAAAFILILCPLLIAGGLSVPASRWTPLLRVMGELSFPLYAVHVPVITLVMYLGGGLATSFAASITVAALFPASRSAIADMVRKSSTPVQGLAAGG